VSIVTHDQSDLVSRSIPPTSHATSMKFSLVLLFLVGGALTQLSLTINTPLAQLCHSTSCSTHDTLPRSSAEVCQPILLTWAGGTRMSSTHRMQFSSLMQCSTLFLGQFHMGIKSTTVLEPSLTENLPYFSWNYRSGFIHALPVDIF
jgi:hypothetical protein